MKIIDKRLFNKDAIELSIFLLGKILVRKLDDGTIIKSMITETEAYMGEEDEACHAFKGRTKRTDVLYQEPGTIYIYLIYGMYYMLNIVAGEIDVPQAVLIRATKDFTGPGKITKNMQIDKIFNYMDITNCSGLYLENSDMIVKYETLKRINIDYASDEYKNKLWRFKLVE